MDVFKHKVSVPVIDGRSGPTSNPHSHGDRHGFDVQGMLTMQGMAANGSLSCSVWVAVTENSFLAELARGLYWGGRL